MTRAERRAFFDRAAGEIERWRRQNDYYHALLTRRLQRIVPPDRAVLEIGCGTGDLLAALRPRLGVGVDASAAMVALARRRHPTLRFCQGDAHDLPLRGPFDYLVISDLVGHLDDVWRAFRQARALAGPDTRIVVTCYNALWEPVLWLAERLRSKMPQPTQNWLSLDDVENLLRLNDFEPIGRGHSLLMPRRVPLLAYWINRFLAPLPGLRRLCLIGDVAARPLPPPPPAPPLRCSVIVPCKDEEGTIDDCIRRMPVLGAGTEIVFVDGNSKDGTTARIEKAIADGACPEPGRRASPHRIRLVHQGEGRGKGDAVRKGFAAATGDVFFILDADLTVPPEDLPKFYAAVAERRGELAMGTRMVYPMEKEAMRTLNLFGNKFFSLAFTWILDQPIKDTLCGTKVLRRGHYEAIAANRAVFGDFDPFGDFDLIFGAARLHHRIAQIPVRYRQRVYGDTKISRFRHGWLLLRMCRIALRHFKWQ